MKKTLVTALLYTVITAMGLGLGYPAAITVLSHVLFHDKANGQLVAYKGEVVGSQLIGQTFTGPGYFHSRPSSAGTGYDAGASSGSNLGPSSKSLMDRVNAAVKNESEGGTDVPVDLVTASASGLDPDISPAAALYQVPRVAHERHLSQDTVTQLVQAHVQPRQLGLLGEPRINVLRLNLALNGLR